MMRRFKHCLAVVPAALALVSCGPKTLTDEEAASQMTAIAQEWKDAIDAQQKNAFPENMRSASREDRLKHLVNGVRDMGGSCKKAAEKVSALEVSEKMRPIRTAWFNCFNGISEAAAAWATSLERDGAAAAAGGEKLATALIEGANGVYTAVQQANKDPQLAAILQKKHGAFLQSLKE